jgi:hypothetical protein
MRMPRLNFTRRLSLGSALLAMLPIGSQADLSRQSPSCPIAIELRVESHVGWGPVEWKLLTDEVDRIWEPYGLTLCWTQRSNPCAGWGVHLTVVVADDLPPSIKAAHLLEPVVGRIRFDADGPSTDIGLSVKAARGLVAEVRLGDRRLEQWPTSTWTALVPRVLGRALAHEIGHYVLQSRGHAKTGLMTASFRPYEVTFGPASWFRLTPDAVTGLQCPLDPAGRGIAAPRAFASRDPIG